MLRELFVLNTLFTVGYLLKGVLYYVLISEQSYLTTKLDKFCSQAIVLSMLHGGVDVLLLCGYTADVLGGSDRKKSSSNHSNFKS